MPPLLPRKRLREDSPSPASKASATKDDSPAGLQKRRKATLYDDLDGFTSPSKQPNSHVQSLMGGDSDSSLSSLSDDDFEDVPLAKRPKVEGSDDEDDEDVEFEDVEAPVTNDSTNVPTPSGDLELTLHKDTRISLTNPFGEKKGPSKRERQVRNATHGVHVITLLWHNAVRNSWLCHPEVQATMISHLPPRMWDEVDRWRVSSGLVKKPAEKKHPEKVSPKGRGKAKSKSKGKHAPHSQARDWTPAAQKLEEGAVDMSHGDPLFRLMQFLVPWWRKRFRVTTPGLRKYGYMSLERLDRWTKAFKPGDYDAGQFGERINDLQEFCKCARKCQGSRDVGAQLFTALLRGLGIESRMVANLQTLGFGWNKLEDAEPEKEEKDGNAQATKKGKLKEKTTPKKQSAKNTPISKQNGEAKNPAKRNPPKREAKHDDVIVIDDSEELGLEFNDSDDDSVIELEVSPKRAPKPPKRFDQDLEYPHYWTEVLSPVTQKFLPVDTIVKGQIATNRELVETFEPRGSKADKARQTMAYIVGYSSDGTAKDVTVRYLKRQMMPGRTKGVRMPPSKVPVYNKHGKVRRYEQFDWFKTALSGYRRGVKSFPITEVDEMEEATDLKPAQPEKKEVKEGEETLQYYKQSKEFALERHLKREEALRPGSKPVKIFKNKGKGGKMEEEDVFLRKDVLNVKSAETWHKQGRAPRPGEMPLKRVPYRAATTNRRREILEAEAATGEKVLQGLFSNEQTDWIIPPPIRDGIIPKNSYGNIDLFVEHMCPRGAVHVPFRGAMRVCKRMGIDYAEAVVDFEFGHRMAVPVIQGVVIAEEYHDQLMVELEKDEAERTRKEDEKRRKAALGRWRKFLMGMRIVERIRQDYGDITDSVSVFGHNKAAAHVITLPDTNGTHEEDEDTAGGFLPEGFEEEEAEDDKAEQESSFFPVVEEDYVDGEDDLIMEDHRDGEDARTEIAEDVDAEAEETTANKSSRKKAPAKTAKKPARKQAVEPKEEKPSRRSTRGAGRRKTVVSEDEFDEEEDEESEEWVNPDDEDE